MNGGRRVGRCSTRQRRAQMGPDWTIALDDALVERYPRCQVCGRAAQTLDAFLVSGLVVMVSRCQRCAVQDSRESTPGTARPA